MSSEKFETLLGLMKRLRAPGGCPWDREQTIETLRPYLIEETYEVLEAIDRGDWTHLPEELGDLQLQIVFQAQIAAEQGLFTIDNVLEAISEKLVRRHPHVFGSESIDTAGGVVHRWEEIKQKEKELKGETAIDALLDAVPRAQPALLEAQQLSKRAAKAGFEWERPERMIEKIQEEAAEVLEARDAGDAAHMEEEIGDLFFMLVNLARRLKVNPELALKQANHKFRRRFGHVESALKKQGRSTADATLHEMEELWREAKDAPK